MNSTEIILKLNYLALRAGELFLKLLISLSKILKCENFAAHFSKLTKYLLFSEFASCRASSEDSDRSLSNLRRGNCKSCSSVVSSGLHECASESLDVLP